MADFSWSQIGSKSALWGIKKGLTLLRKSLFYNGSGGRIRTYDLWVMSPTSYQAAPPRDSRDHRNSLSKRKGLHQGRGAINFLRVLTWPRARQNRTGGSEIWRHRERHSDRRAPGNPRGLSRKHFRLHPDSHIPCPSKDASTFPQVTDTIHVRQLAPAQDRP